MKGVITRKRAIREALRAADSPRPWESRKTAFLYSLVRQGYGIVRASATVGKHIRIDSIPAVELPQRVPLEALED